MQIKISSNEKRDCIDKALKELLDENLISYNQVLIKPNDNLSDYIESNNQAILDINNDNTKDKIYKVLKKNNCLYEQMINVREGENWH